MKALTGKLTTVKTLGGLLPAALLLFVLAAPAGAHRAPTAKERSAISRALHASAATKAVRCFHVRAVVVSTVGPWARARVVRCSGGGDEALAVLELKRGRWHVRDLGTSGTGCTVAPRRVRHDLRLDCH
jgi:hypothetical protein